MEDYSKTELLTSLTADEILVCTDRNIEVIKSLLNLLLKTQNSADENPSKVLGEMFICQPNLVSATYKTLSKDNRLQLAEIFSFGFENAAHNKQEMKDIEILRAKLKSLLSGK